MWARVFEHHDVHQHYNDEVTFRGVCPCGCVYEEFSVKGMIVWSELTSWKTHTHKQTQKHSLTHTHLTHTQSHTHAHTYSHTYTMKDTHTRTTYRVIPGHRNHVFDPASVFLSKRDLYSKQKRPKEQETGQISDCDFYVPVSMSQNDLVQKC